MKQLYQWRFSDSAEQGSAGIIEAYDLRDAVSRFFTSDLDQGMNSRTARNNIQTHVLNAIPVNENQHSVILEETGFYRLEVTQAG